MAKRPDAVQRIVRSVVSIPDEHEPAEWTAHCREVSRKLAAKIRKLSNSRYLDGMKDERERVYKAVLKRWRSSTGEVATALNEVITDIAGPLSGAPTRARKSK